MKKQQFQPLTPAALYARVSRDRQDVDLSAIHTIPTPEDGPMGCGRRRSRLEWRSSHIGHAGGTGS